jgi:O-acetyl-ADP-ribose deacetylase (regulator of RNase III)
MSVKTIAGDLLQETAGVIVHGCNAQGVMNAGIAKKIRYKHPRVYNDYLQAHQTTGLKLGQIITTQVDESLYVISGITQYHYGRDTSVNYVNYDAISEVFSQVKRVATRTCLPVKFPAIGAGLGGGHWLTIQSIIEARLCPGVEAILFVY